ncbi:MAG: hypothetical protein AAB299_04765 [Thermodesulfobacteriota bacterium]
MDEVKKEQLREKNFLIVDLLEGNLGLAMTYWVYGVLGGIVWAVGISALNPDRGSDLEKFVWVLFAGYYFFTYVGIWNAANKYVGRKVWSILAKFAIIIIVVPITIHFFKWLVAD